MRFNTNSYCILQVCHSHHQLLLHHWCHTPGRTRLHCTAAFAWGWWLPLRYPGRLLFAGRLRRSRHPQWIHQLQCSSMRQQHIHHSSQASVKGLDDAQKGRPALANDEVFCETWTCCCEASGQPRLPIRYFGISSPVQVLHL